MSERHAKCDTIEVFSMNASWMPWPYGATTAKDFPILQSLLVKSLLVKSRNPVVSAAPFSCRLPGGGVALWGHGFGLKTKLADSKQCLRLGFEPLRSTEL